MTALDDGVRRFCDDDVKTLMKSQADITANLALASTNLAVASNNIDWIVKTYTTEYSKLADLQLEITNLKVTFWKYIGIGIGASAAISFVIAVLPYILRMSG